MNDGRKEVNGRKFVHERSEGRREEGTKCRNVARERQRRKASKEGSGGKEMNVDIGPTAFSHRFCSYFPYPSPLSRTSSFSFSPSPSLPSFFIPSLLLSNNLLSFLSIRSCQSDRQIEQSARGGSSQRYSRLHFPPPLLFPVPYRLHLTLASLPSQLFPLFSNESFLPSSSPISLLYLFLRGQVALPHARSS